MSTGVGAEPAAQPGEANGGLASLLPLKDFFYLDVRSLALLRIGLGLVLLCDWVDRLPDLSAHYTDAGIVPRNVITDTVPISIHFYSGEVWYQDLLAGVAILFALALLVGYKTPLALLGSWFLLISVHARNPAVWQGGDMLLRLLLFWSLFLPVGACFSVDAARSAVRPTSPRVLSPGSVAYILQLCMVYWFASASKWGPEWRIEGVAVYMTLQIDAFTTRFGRLLREYQEVCRWLTYGTLYLETLGPVLLFVPFASWVLRLLVIAAFLVFHAGLALSLELSNFPWVCAVAWLALLPTEFWDRISRSGLLSSPAFRWLRQPLPDAEANGPGQPEQAQGRPAWAPASGPIANAVVIGCLAYITLWNINTLDQQYKVYGPGAESAGAGERPFFVLPPQMAPLGHVLGIDQGWGLFAPSPLRVHGWVYVAGMQRNGELVDVLKGGGPVDAEKPELLSATYPNGRWRKLIMNLPPEAGYPYLRPHYARYEFEQWNRTHAGSEQLLWLDVVWMKEETTLPGQVRSSPTVNSFRYTPQKPTPP